MAVDRGYISVADYKLYKNSTATGTFDSLIEDLIEAASRYIDAKSHRFFYSSTGKTAYYTPELSNVLFIDDLYAITTLKTDEDGDGTFETTWTTGATGDYYLMPFNAASFGNSGAYAYQWIEVNPEGDYSFPKSFRSVQVIGDFGWSGVPADIKQACLEIVNAAYLRRSGQNMSAVAEVTGAGVVLTPEDIPRSASNIINAYRKII
jgi:hypothetical protein